MKDYFYNLGKKNGFSKQFLQQLNKTGSALSNSYLQSRNSLNSEYDSAVNDYNTQKDTKKAEALKSGRDAYVNYAKSINPFSSSANSYARIGLDNSGFGESQNIKAMNSYQTNVGNVETTRDLALRELDSQIKSLENKRASALAELTRNEEKDQYENYYNIRQLVEDEKARELAKKQASSSSSSSGGSSSGSSSGSYVIDDSTKYKANYSAQGLSKNGMKISNSIAKTIQKHGYVTSNWLNKMLASASSKDAKKIRTTMKKVK